MQGKKKSLDRNSLMVRNYLERHGIKQNFLAKRIGMSPKTLNGMLCGHREMPDSVYAKAVQVLEIAEPERMKIDARCVGGDGGR